MTFAAKVVGCIRDLTGISSINASKKLLSRLNRLRYCIHEGAKLANLHQKTTQNWAIFGQTEQESDIFVYISPLKLADFVAENRLLSEKEETYCIQDLLIFGEIRLK